MSGIDFTPFAELPESLVLQVLDNSEKIGENLFNSLNKIKASKNDFRKQLEEANLLGKDVDLGNIPIPTTCGVDGSYAADRLLSQDLVACAAVSVEGLIPPSEIRLREKPDHQVFISPENHNPETSTLIRALMAEMEIDLSVSSPHDVVFMDGSLSSRIIHLNQGFSKIKIPKSNVEKEILRRLEDLLINYETILKSEKSDKQWVSVPKYTSRRELGSKFKWPTEYDDRALMTLILASGEFTHPIKISSDEEDADDKDKWHLNLPSSDSKLENLRDKIENSMYDLNVLYYRPNSFTPALRIEISAAIAENKSRLATVLQALRFQCNNPTIFEPYPLYMADRMVKHLPSALPAFRQTAIRKMAELSDGDLTEILFSMQPHRTDD